MNDEVRARLAAHGIRLDEADLEQLARMLPQIARWEHLLAAIGTPETEPAPWFRPEA